MDADRLQLSVNTDYNRPDDFRRSMVGLSQMLDHSENLLTHFARAENPAIGFSAPQIAEEKLKAELILANDDWRPLIGRGRESPVFSWADRFPRRLLRRCGGEGRIRTLNLDRGFTCNIAAIVRASPTSGGTDVHWRGSERSRQPSLAARTS
jgi:hypothetical protein